MDRIYYFLLAEEIGNCRKDTERRNIYYPVFRLATPLHEVYYLQMRECVSSEELSGVQAHMEKALGRLKQWYGEEQNHAYLVYSPPFEKWLIQNGFLKEWQEKWNLPFYQEYEEFYNLNFLLQEIGGGPWPKHLLILGNAPGVSEWLPKLARTMKTVTFCLEEQPKEYERVRSCLLEEYGMLVKWVDSLNQYPDEAALVLDYWGREKLYMWTVGRGSIWIDMTSMECRRRAVEDRDTGIRYISLKAFWREEMQQTLDTANKIKYNTGVILEGKVGL